MSELKAIQTEYNGCRFRSRLEARWAVFFDAAGIKYVYEPEGFEWATECNLKECTPEPEGVRCDVCVRSKKWRYLPDFYLPETDVYVEVKGSDEALKNDSAKIAGAIENTVIGEKGLIILGNIPDDASFGWGNSSVHAYLYEEDDVDDYQPLVKCGWAVFQETRTKAIVRKIKRDEQDEFFGNWFSFGAFRGESVSWEGRIPGCVKIDNGKMQGNLYSFNTKANINKCLRKARGARFEYGECPDSHMINWEG